MAYCVELIIDGQLGLYQFGLKQLQWMAPVFIVVNTLEVMVPVECMVWV